MNAQVLKTDDGTALVEVYDRQSNRHLVEVDVETGDVGRHGQDDYPRPDSPDRTEEHERIIEQVRQRAIFEVHVSTGYDVLDPAWDPKELERAIEALRGMPIEEFEAAFEEYYRLLDDPDRLKRKHDVSAETAPVDDDPVVTMVSKFFCVDRNGDVVDVPSGELFYYSVPGAGVQYRGGVNPDCPGGTTRFAVLLPPRTREPAEDFEYPEDFRGALVQNLVCQIRDVFRNMGEEVPSQYDIDGVGKVESMINAEPR